MKVQQPRILRWIPAGLLLPLAVAVILPSPAAPQGILGASDRQLVASLQRRIDRGNIARGLRVFASLDRISGGPGEAAAARYITGELDRFGVPYKVHTLRLYLSWPVEATVALDGRRIQAVPPSFSASTAPEGLTGVLAYAGRAADDFFRATGRELDGARVHGRIAVVEGLVSPQSALRAAEAGAIGLVHVNTGERLHEMIATPVWGTPTPADVPWIPRIPILSVRRSDGAAILEAARRGGSATLHTEVSTAWRESPLVVAEVPGRSEEFVLLSSHLDAWYAGMTDTGGTDVTLVELARLLHEARGQLRRSVRIAWWNGHSTGRYAGSTWFADHYFSDLDRLCVGYVNLDGPGTKGVPLDVASTWAWPELMGFVDELARELTGRDAVHEYVSEDPERIRPPRAGDSSFQGIGVPELSLGVTELPKEHPDRLPYVGGSQGAWWWHTPEDTVDKLSMDVLVRDAEWRLASLVALLNARILPYRISAIAAAYSRVLGELEQERLDLGEPLSLARELEAVARDLEGRILAPAASLDEARAARINRTLLRASHVLNSTLYTAAGRFGQDPATPQPLLPALDGARELRALDPRSDRYGFLLTELVRGRNRVEAALREAIEALRDAGGGGTPAETFLVLKSVPVPRNPHGIAFSRDGSKVYLVSSAGQALTVLDAATHGVLETFPLTDTPLGIVLTPDGEHAAVSHFGADRISRIDLETGTIDKTLQVGGRPSLFAAARDGRRAFVSCESADRVYEIDLEAFEIIGSFATGKRPFPPALTSDSRWLFVPGYDSGDVTIIDLVARRPGATVAVGNRPSGGSVLPGDREYAVVNRGSNSLSVIDPHSGRVRLTLTAGIEPGPFSFVLSPDGRLGFVNNTAAASVSVIDVERFAVIGRVAVGGQPIVMAVHPSGRALYVACEGSHELVVVAIPSSSTLRSQPPKTGSQ